MKHHLQFLWLTCRFLCSIFHNLFIPQPMKRLLFLLLCAISLSLQAQSPHYIWGKVIDAFTYEPLDSVHVSILSKDSTLITQFQSKQSQNMTFTSPIKSVKNGTYIFRFSKAGYKDTYQNFRIKSLKNRSFSTDVGIVKLDKKNLIHMKEVAVNATMVRMVYKGDTLVYNAAAFKTAQGSMLDRLIAMLPGFELHPNGQIFVNGRQVSSLLINGEDFFKGKPSVALNNLPAYMVDKVKVYEKMSDRDKALGMDKTRYAQLPLVVDVNLKKEYSIGWIANATAGYGTNNHYVGKAFALRFSPRTRWATYATVNDGICRGLLFHGRQLAVTQLQTQHRKDHRRWNRPFAHPPGRQIQNQCKRKHQVYGFLCGHENLIHLFSATGQYLQKTKQCVTKPKCEYRSQG